MNIDQFQSGEQRKGLWLAQVTHVLQRRLFVIIVQQPENQKTTRPFVELTDKAESFFRLYLKCQHKQIAGPGVKAAGCLSLCRPFRG
ncbi:hypothetical protein [Pseudomonas putida]|uniref:hypothetical protein n=1 Tax=Pseudomonas putida TaxID=303 RepID=UPI00300EFB18